MRILYCNKYNFPFSGTEKYLFEVMDLMRSHGHEVALFSAANLEEDENRSENHSAPQTNFDLKKAGPRENAKRGLRAIYSWKARRSLRQTIQEFRPDIAHVRNIYHHLSPSILAELKAQKIPVLYHLNDFKMLCPSYNMVSNGNACERCQGGRFWHVITEGCYSGRAGASVMLAAEAYTHKWLGTYRNCVDQFLAPSQFVKHKLVEHGWDDKKIEVLPHFQKLSENISTPAQNAFILYFGRLSPEKGVADLLEAMRLLPHVKLQIAGEGLQRAELERITRSLGLKNVEFLGQLQGRDLERAIVGSQFTVLPSRAYETFGKSIAESYAWARAVVASDLGSRRELVREGETGLLYPVGNTKKLAEAIASLIAHPDIANKMGRAGRTLIQANHSPEQHYSRLLALYEKLGKRTSGAAPIAPSRRLKVAFIGGRGVVSKYSGIETYYEELGKRLAAKGHEVTIYCRNYFTPKIKRHEQMRIVRLPTIRSKHLETFIHTLLSTFHAMFGGYDIVHYHALGPALFSFLPRLTGKKTAVTVQGLDWQRKKWGGAAACVLRLGEKAAVGFPNETMVVSRVLENFYRTRYRRETRYIPNGTFLRECNSSSNLERWGLQKGEYILFLGRFSPEKNCHLLIEAYQRIQTPVKLVLAGGSSHSEAYVSELRKHANAKILLLDWVTGPALDELLLNAMLFVLPSDLEGMSLALLDAMGAGVSVLASDVPENCELVNGVGFTFAHGDVSELERMLRFLISSPALRNAKARLAQRKISKTFLWPHIAEAVERVYLQMTAPASQPAQVLPLAAKTRQPKIAA